MSYTNGLDKPTDYFNTVLYTGNGTARDITTGLTSTDWVWIKRRDGTANHRFTDVVRGATNMLSSNNTNATQTHAQTVTAFGTNTFSLGTDSGSYDVNTSSQSYVSWNWSAGGTASSNTDGSITSSVSANTTAGFSIGTYSANATAGATVGHGLGVAPDMLIVKPRNADNNWAVYHKSMGETKAMYLDGTSAETTDGWLNNTAPSSSVFTLSGGNYGNASGYNVVFYAFAEKKGYSKFGSYTGNGNSDGTFVYTGFKPSWVMIKQSSASGEDWFICDNKREGYNAENNRLLPNLSSSESTDSPIDILSNGFKARQSGAAVNGSGSTYIYMTFADSPFVTSTGIPTTAR